MDLVYKLRSVFISQLSAFGLFFLCLLIFLPLITLIFLGFLSPLGKWNPTLPIYLLNSFFLVAGGGGICLVWGVSIAWLLVHYSFPLHKTLSWFALLPLACPAYLAGFIYGDLFEGIFAIRSIGVAMILFGSALFPYVYIFTRAGFIQQSINYQLAGHSLGLNRWQNFYRISVPMALPFISFGCLLAIIEIINDFGLVDYYAINTLSLGIYRTWLGKGDFVSAVQLSLLVLIILAILMVGEASLLKQQKRFENLSRQRSLRIKRLTGWRGFAACCWCLVPIIIGFILPVSVLIVKFIHHSSWVDIRYFFAPLKNTFLLAGLTIFFCISLSLVLNYAVRSAPRQLRSLGQLTNLCYALPGTLLSLAIIALLSKINGYLLSTGLFALLYGYLVRFTPPANRIIHNSLEKITLSVERAAQGFGLKKMELMRLIHFPLLKGSILSSMIIIFTELLKELPLTLMLRPFNFDTLAISVYQYASDERLNTAAGFALLLILAGLPALYFFNRLITQTRAEEILH